MNTLKCIIILFLISLFFTLLIKEDTIEGLDPNILKVYYKDINENVDPSLAGSIDLPKKKNNDSNSNLYKIYDEDLYINMMKNNKAFIEEKKPQIIKKEDNKKFFNERYSDYAPYEKILPPIDFAEYNKIQDLNKKITSTNATRRMFSENNNNNDCEGIWGDWDESVCKPGKMCSIKSRKYKVLKEKTSGGKDCPYKDGEEEHAYCYGETNEGRCGLPSNACECDVNNYDEDKCNKDTMNLDCNCPNGYTLSNRGKCVISVDDLDNLDSVGLSNAEIDTLREIIANYSGSGTEPVGVSTMRGESGSELLSLAALFDFENRVERQIDEIDDRLETRIQAPPPSQASTRASGGESSEALPRLVIEDDTSPPSQASTTASGGASSGGASSETLPRVEDVILQNQGQA